MKKLIHKKFYMKHDEIQRKYNNHVFLQKKSKGITKELKGDVIVIVLFVNDENSKWTQSDIDANKQVYNSAFSLLLNLAENRNVNLQLRKAFQEITLPLVCTRENRQAWSKAIAELYNRSSLTEFQEYYKKKYKCDEAPIMIAFNKDFRSYAMSDVGSKYTMDEYSAIKSNCSPRTIIHELLHQFGAVDFYFPEEVRSLMKKLRYKSVMNCDNSNCIDILTAYLIGWTAHIRDEEIVILEGTKHFTEDMLNKAKKQEWAK